MKLVIFSRKPSLSEIYPIILYPAYPFLDCHRKIHTDFKDHFISDLCSTNAKYPAQEWDHLLPQATMTLNLLLTSRTTPKLSAYAAIFGIHDFNRCHLSPPSTKVIFHEKTNNRPPWSPHGTDGWYIGPSMEQYRCVQCFMPSTPSARNVDTITSFTAAIPLTKMET